MLNILAIAFALVAVFAIKAAVMLRSQDNVIGKSTSFSWVAPEQPTEGATPAWMAEEAPKASMAVAAHSLRRIQSARAF